MINEQTYQWFTAIYIMNDKNKQLMWHSADQFQYKKISNISNAVNNYKLNKNKNSCCPVEGQNTSSNAKSSPHECLIFFYFFFWFTRIQF